MFNYALKFSLFLSSFQGFQGKKCRGAPIETENIKGIEANWMHTSAKEKKNKKNYFCFVIDYYVPMFIILKQ